MRWFAFAVCAMLVAAGLSGGDAGSVSVAPTVRAVTGAVPVAPGDGTTVELPRRRDVNGDGRDDFVAVTSAGTAVVVFGSARRTRLEVSRLGSGGYVIAAPQGRAFRSARVVGDVDGDGLADIGLVESGDQARGYIVYGKRDSAPITVGEDPTVALVLGQVGVWDSGGQLEPAGDVNGDGKDDVLVPPELGGPLAWLVLGAARDQRVEWQTSTRTAAYRAAGPFAEDFGDEGVFGLGDVNGDGRDDVGVLATVDLCDAYECEKALWVAFGRPTISTYRLDYRTPGTPGESFRATVTADDGRPAGFYYSSCDCTVEHVAPIGDHDGDGRGDVLANVLDTASDTLAVKLVRGRRTTSPVYRRGPLRHALIPRFGFQATLGDVDGDRQPDLGTGYAIVHLNRTLRPRRRTVLQEPSDRDIIEMFGIGDIDGDRLADFHVGYDDASSAIVYGSRSHRPVDLARDKRRVLRLP